MAAESELEGKIVKEAQILGFLTFKFTSPSQRGVPDRIFISPKGAVLFLEIKALGKKPTPLQFYRLHKLRAHKVAAWWVDNLTMATCMLADIQNRPERFNEIYS